MTLVRCRASLRCSARALAGIADLSGRASVAVVKGSNCVVPSFGVNLRKSRGLSATSVNTTEAFPGRVVVKFLLQRKIYAVPFCHDGTRATVHAAIKNRVLTTVVDLTAALPAAALRTRPFAKQVSEASPQCIGAIFRGQYLLEWGLGAPVFNASFRQVMSD